MKNKISIIIPTLNEADHMEGLIGYLRKNGGTRIAEIIIADGGSHDGTVELARQMEAETVVAQGVGRGAQLNKGATVATGSILYFIHADTLPPASFVADIDQALGEGYELGCYRSGYPNGHPLMKINALFTRLDKMWCRGGDQTLFITRKLFDVIGGYSDDYVIMEDYEILQRARKKAAFKIMPKAAQISTRKYDHNSILRVNVANFIVFNMFRLGYHPVTLHNTYQRLIRHPKRVRFERNRNGVSRIRQKARDKIS